MILKEWKNFFIKQRVFDGILLKNLRFKIELIEKDIK